MPSNLLSATNSGLSNMTRTKGVRTEPIGIRHREKKARSDRTLITRPGNELGEAHCSVVTLAKKIAMPPQSIVIVSTAAIGTVSALSKEVFCRLIQNANVQLGHALTLKSKE